MKTSANVEMNLRRSTTLTLFCLFAALTAGAQSRPQNLPVTDAEKIADALRAAPQFITAGATIVDYPASKGDEWRVLRKGSSEWTCLPGPPPGSMHDDPGCFDKVFFQFVKDVLAGRPQHVNRLGVAYVYGSHGSGRDRRTVPRRTPHNGCISSSRRARGFHPWRVGRHIRHTFARRRSPRSMVSRYTNTGG
jgi:hypothetical protein